MCEAVGVAISDCERDTSCDELGDCETVMLSVRGPVGENVVEREAVRMPVVDRVRL
jgi:hypothetical protein